MLCPHCGSESGDDARSCPSCGYKFTLDTQDSLGTDEATQERRLKIVLRIFFAILILAAGMWLVVRGVRTSSSPSVSSPNRALIAQPVMPATLKLKPRSFALYAFSVPPGCERAQLNGQFRLHAASGDPAEVLVVDESGLQMWKARSRGTVLYRSGRSLGANIALQLLPRTTKYYVVVDNRAAAGILDVRDDLKLTYMPR